MVVSPEDALLRVAGGQSFKSLDDGALDRYGAVGLLCADVAVAVPIVAPSYVRACARLIDQNPSIGISQARSRSPDANPARQPQAAFA